MRLIKLTTAYSFTFLIFIICTNFASAQTENAEIYNVEPGEGNGIRFWSNNIYSISMGNSSLYQYGTVTDYSIKSTMNGNIGRGWTWGDVYQQPVTALDNTGNFQTKGYIKSEDRTIYFGNKQRLWTNDKQDLVYFSNHSDISRIMLFDKENENYGSLLGTNNGAKFGIRDSDNDWSLLIAKDDYTSFEINGSEKMRIEDNGFVGIGTTTPQNALDVCGAVRGKEVLVEETWCDYVFDEGYDLPTLEEEKEHIENAGYLLGFESEEEMAGEINVGDVTKRQQRKIEEQMLHIINLSDKNKELKELVLGLVKDVEVLKAQIQK